MMVAYTMILLYGLFIFVEFTFIHFRSCCSWSNEMYGNAGLVYFSMTAHVAGISKSSTPAESELTLFFAIFILSNKTDLYKP
jgi:hypothetical protein